jgi:hypothetical protein
MLVNIVVSFVKNRLDLVYPTLIVMLLSEYTIIFDHNMRFMNISRGEPYTLIVLQMIDLYMT